MHSEANLRYLETRYSITNLSDQQYLYNSTIRTAFFSCRKFTTREPRSSKRHSAHLKVAQGSYVCYILVVITDKDSRNPTLYPFPLTGQRDPPNRLRIAFIVISYKPLHILKELTQTENIYHKRMYYGIR